MTSFIETIRIENGRPRNITFHNYRFNKTRVDHFGVVPYIDLSGILSHLAVDEAYAKCRILYNEGVIDIGVKPYRIKPIHSLQLVHAESIDYGYKYADRQALDELYDLRASCDDILIIKNGLVTDSYYANVAFYRNGLFYTPATPLLKGTMRQKLLKTGKIIPVQLRIQDILRYEYVTLFNAMIPISAIKVPVGSIVM